MFHILVFEIYLINSINSIVVLLKCNHFENLVSENGELLILMETKFQKRKMRSHTSTVTLLIIKESNQLVK